MDHAIDHTFDDEKLARVVNEGGFRADSCSRCKRTANVPDHEYGWFCVCGNFVPGVTEGHWPGPLYETPDIGPNASQVALARARQQEGA